MCIAEEAKEQQPPAFIREIVAIRIPKVAAKDSTIFELVYFLAHRIVELDPHKPGGISFLTVGFGGAEDKGNDRHIQAAKKLDYSGENLRVDKVLTDLARLFDVEFHVTSVGVVVTPSGMQPFPNPKSDKGELYYTFKSKPGEQAAPSDGDKPSKRVHASIPPRMRSNIRQKLDGRFAHRRSVRGEPRSRSFALAPISIRLPHGL